MAKVDELSYEIANGLDGGYTRNSLYFTSTRSTEKSFEFRFTSTFEKKSSSSSLSITYKLYKKSTPSVIILTKTLSISIPVKDKNDKVSVNSSDLITITESLESNTEYVISAEYNAVIDGIRYNRIVTKNFKTSQSEEDKSEVELLNQNRNFNHLFKKLPTYHSASAGSPNYQVTGYGITATKIGTENVFYRYGKCNYCTNDVKNPLFYNSIVPNCVGYAHGRLKEVWSESWDQGYIKKDGDTYYLPKNGSRVITGVVDIYGFVNYINKAPAPPILNAAQWWDYWPTQYPGWTKSQSPALGAVMCWGGGWGGCGHVAFVEQVESNGDVIVSESYYNGSRGHINKYYKSNNYAMNGHTFKGFLISPVCQLGGSSMFGFEQDIILEINKKPVEILDQATYTELSHIHEIKLTEALSLNDKVEIQWFGNTKGDGTGKSVGHLTSIGRISKINWNNKYPYEITLNKEVIGYYDRSSLIKYNGSSLSSSGVLSLLGNIKTNNNVLYTATVNVGNSSLYIRSNASKTSNILGSLKTGAVVNVYETKTQNGYTWCKISPNRNEWVASGDANETWLVVDSSTTSESYLYRAEAKAELNKRKTPEYKSDGSNIHKNSNGSNQKVSQGEIVSVYEEINTPDSYDYVWRRIGENVWVADSDKAYPFGHYLAKIDESPVSTPKASKKTISVHPNIEIYVRSTPAIRDDNKLYKLSPGTYIGHWYGETTVADGYTWYRISETESKWVAGANLVFSS